MGDDINTAARLMSNATWGDVYLSRRTKEQIDAYFELEDKGEIKVKGKEIRIPTFKLLGSRGQVGQTRGLEEGASPLTGRQAQLELLQKSIQDFTKNRRGQIISLIGNSGLGKSRLMSEFKERLVKPDQPGAPLWIEVRAFSFSEQVNYWVAAQIMSPLLHTKPNPSQDDLLYALSERCEAFFGEDSMNATPYLAHMMGLELGEEWSWVKTTDPKVRQKQIFRTAAQFFIAAAKEQPFILALDDLHWADEASLSLIAHLFSVTDKAPIIFCMAFRPRTDKQCWKLHEQAVTNYHHRYLKIDLEPLSGEMSAALLQDLLPGAIFTKEIHADILAKAAGNPFYLEEVVRSLRESSAVERIPEDPSQWRITDKIGAIKVPGTLQAAIASRIDRLTEDTRQALQMASVLGRQFRLFLFENLAKAEEEVNSWLSQLERDGLLRPQRSEDDLLYNFPDALVQEVAYDSLLANNRQELHRRAGEILENNFIRVAQETGQDIEQALLRNCEPLAFHFGKSSDQDRALKYSEMAVKRARDQYANQTAIDYYKQIAKIHKDRSNPAAQSSALYNAGVIAYEIGDYDLARKMLQESADLQHTIGDTNNEAWSILYVGMVELKQANYPQALARHGHAMQLAQERADKKQEGIHLTNLARVHLRMGQYDLTLEELQKSLEMKKSQNDYPGVGFALYYRSLVYIYRSLYTEAEAALQGAFEAWGTVNKNERLMSFYHYGAGLLALEQKQFANAQEHLEKSLELCNKIEMRGEAIDVLSALSLVKLGQSDLDAALAASSQAIKQLAAQKDVEEVQQIYLNHARVLAARNDPSANEYLQKARETMMERAGRLENDEQRRIYLEQAKVNQDIAALCKA